MTLRGARNSPPPASDGTILAAVITDTTLDPRLAERERVLSELRKAAPHLRARGITHLSLFGSMARGEDRPKATWTW